MDSSAKKMCRCCVLTARQCTQHPDLMGVVWMYTGATFTICKAQCCGGDLFVFKPRQSNIRECTVPVLAVYPEAIHSTCVYRCRYWEW